MGRQPDHQDTPGGRPPRGSAEPDGRDPIRQYVLGELSEEEQEEVERRLLSEGDYFEELLIAEEELTDDFISDRLADHNRAKFSRRFLAVPELRQDVRFAKALRMHAAQHAQRSGGNAEAERPPPLLLRLKAFFTQPAVGFGLAAALLAVCAATWMAVQNSRLRAQVEQLQARQTPPPTPQAGLQEQLAAERERGEELAAQLRREQEQRADAERRLEEARRQAEAAPTRREQPARPAVASVFTLTPGLVRASGAEMTRVSVPPGGGRVLMHLDLAADDYPAYRATLKTLEGAELHSASALRARAGRGGRIVPFVIPSEKLAPDNDYQISLTGRAATGAYEEVGTYHFRVIR